MNGKILLTMVLLILVMLPGVQALESEEVGVQISFEPQPQVGTPSTVYIEVQDATGKAIPGVQLNLQIIVPHARARMVSGVFYSPDGKLEFLYNFQDAEPYVFTLNVTPTDATPAEFKPFTKSYAVEVGAPEEPRGIWMKTWIILMGVVLGGMGIGYFATKKLRAI